MRTVIANSITHCREKYKQDPGKWLRKLDFPSTCRKWMQICVTASALSAVEPSIASIDPSNPVSTKIKCIICLSTEEKEGICKKKKKKDKVLNQFVDLRCFQWKRPHARSNITFKCKHVILKILTNLLLVFFSTYGSAGKLHQLCFLFLERDLLCFWDNLVPWIVFGYHI